ncbi:MAG: hypothetical protein IJ222_00670 [Bacteroidales bacterium]|nr:hypothetical protein [Bacteroidales bacterium]
MKHFTTLLSLVLFLSSCGTNGSGSEAENSVEEIVPITFETAFRQSYGPRVSQIPDTLALGYYWGMTRAQTNTHEKELVQSKKVHYEKWDDRYTYTMPLTHFDESGNQTKNYSFVVSSVHYNDTLKVLNLLLSSWGRAGLYTMEDLYKEFGPVFESKGYLCKAVSPEESMRVDPKYGLRAAAWVGTEYRFVKDNTLIRLWRGTEWPKDLVISYYDMSVVYKEQRDIAAKEEEAAKKAAAENAAREEQKKDYLRDF